MSPFLVMDQFVGYPSGALSPQQGIPKLLSECPHCNVARALPTQSTSLILTVNLYYRDFFLLCTHSLGSSGGGGG